jgi:hypothetical protein
MTAPLSHAAPFAVLESCPQRLNLQWGINCNPNFKPTTRVTVDGCAIPQISSCEQLERAAACFYDELLMLARNP